MADPFNFSVFLNAIGKISGIEQELRRVEKAEAKARAEWAEISTRRQLLAEARLQASAELEAVLKPEAADALKTEAAEQDAKARENTCPDVAVTP